MLKTLRLKGLADATLIERALRIGMADATARLEALAQAGHVRTLPRGATLTPQGRSELAALEAAERARLDNPALERVHEGFLVVNATFKALMKDWQVRSVNGTDVPNDHQDAVYDAGVVARLAGVDAALAPVLTETARLVPRLAVYAARFSDALAAVRGGERAMMAAPNRDSYHTVWFELHEDLTATLGIHR